VEGRFFGFPQPLQGQVACCSCAFFVAVHPCGCPRRSGPPLGGAYSYESHGVQGRVAGPGARGGGCAGGRGGAQRLVPPRTAPRRAPPWPPVAPCRAHPASLAAADERSPFAGGAPLAARSAAVATRTRPTACSGRQLAPARPVPPAAVWPTCVAAAVAWAHRARCNGGRGVGGGWAAGVAPGAGGAACAMASSGAAHASPGRVA
jgi:hypothetical protein